MNYDFFLLQLLDVTLWHAPCGLGRTLLYVFNLSSPFWIYVYFKFALK